MCLDVSADLICTERLYCFFNCTVCNLDCDCLMYVILFCIKNFLEKNREPQTKLCPHSYFIRSPGAVLQELIITHKLLLVRNHAHFLPHFRWFHNKIKVTLKLINRIERVLITSLAQCMTKGAAYTKNTQKCHKTCLLCFLPTAWLRLSPKSNWR